MQCRRCRIFIWTAVVLLMLASCQGGLAPDTPSPAPDATTTAAPPPTALLPTPPPPPVAVNTAPTVAPDAPMVAAATTGAAAYGYTHLRADGNRVVEGKGQLPQLAPLDIPLAGRPRWVVALPLAEGALWAVVLEDNSTQAFQVVGRQVSPVSVIPQTLERTAPLLTIVDGQASFLVPPTGSPGGNHPILLPEEDDLAFSNAAGELFLVDKSARGLGEVDVTILPDGRLLADEQGRLLVLSGPTTRYEHGVLGDAVEASAVSLIEARPTARVLYTISIPEPQVVEGIAPIWTDWDGDGEREIIVTVADAREGARVVVYDEAGEQLAAGPAIGQGYRWRHQIAVAPFGPGGEMELVDVLTPHLGGIVEFYQWTNNELRVVAQVGGYTSHVLGSRNLDLAIAGDFDGNERYELLLPNQARSELGAIRRTGDGAEVAWSVELGGTLSSNTAAVTLANGDIAVAAGRQDGILRIWQP